MEVTTFKQLSKTKISKMLIWQVCLAIPMVIPIFYAFTHLPSSLPSNLLHLVTKPLQVHFSLESTSLTLSLYEQGEKFTLNMFPY